MICPTCDRELQKLEVSTNSGGKFSVEHCGRCGGTWFDPYEINRIPYHEVARIAHLTVLPKEPTSEHTIHKCPRCHKELISSHFASLPKGIRMLRCHRCNGIWATQKALEVFKKHQEETTAEYKTGTSPLPSLSVVFVPAILVLLLMLVTFLTVFSLQQSKEERIKAENTVTNLLTLPVSKTSVRIFFQTKSALKSTLSYGIDPFSFVTVPISEQPSTNHSLILTGLTPETLYTFKIKLTDELGRTYTTSENSFITSKNQ